MILIVQLPWAVDMHVMSVLSEAAEPQNDPS